VEIPHIPVIKDETIEFFKDLKDGYVIDCTTGFGGHSEAILESNPNIKLICNDRDEEALAFSKKRLEPFKDRVEFTYGAFSTVFDRVADKNIVGVLADIGVSSLQLDKLDRGFSFNSQTLDMRMDTNQQLTAKDVVNGYSINELETIFKEYGEIREYKKIARIICDDRKNKKFETSIELASLIEKHFKKAKIHPATLAFQAIRIEVNKELDELSILLNSVKNSNMKDGIVAIITFHSLEDKIVKNTFRDWTKSCICPQEVMRCECGDNHDIGKNLTKKPIIASKEEVNQNPRSRSAKLRVFAIKR
jgi:16S rRNA (cytosine1402-N4)-methyltransferase